MKPGSDEVCVRGISASGLRAPSVFLLDPREHHGAALQVGDADGDAAEVVVDEAAVGAEPDQLAVVVRCFLQRGVE